MNQMSSYTETVSLTETGNVKKVLEVKALKEGDVVEVTIEEMHSTVGFVRWGVLRTSQKGLTESSVVHANFYFGSTMEENRVAKELELLYTQGFLPEDAYNRASSYVYDISTRGRNRARDFDLEFGRHNVAEACTQKHYDFKRSLVPVHETHGDSGFSEHFMLRTQNDQVANYAGCVLWSKHANVAVLNLRNKLAGDGFSPFSQHKNNLNPYTQGEFELDQSYSCLVMIDGDDKWGKVFYLRANSDLAYVQSYLGVLFASDMFDASQDADKERFLQALNDYMSAR